MSKRPVRRTIARLFLALTGWKPDGGRPEPKQYVLIAAPHTSNWDFAYLLAFSEYFEMQISWMGKNTLFRGPMGPVMRFLGGVSVVRHQRENMVVAMARIFQQPEHEEFGLAVPAEGTRARSEYWKSGFYHIANTAGVPIVMSYLDYERKRGGFSPPFKPSGDIPDDMETVRAFYAGRQGKFPELFGPIRLREEDPEDD